MLRLFTLPADACKASDGACLGKRGGGQEGVCITSSATESVQAVSMPSSVYAVSVAYKLFAERVTISSGMTPVQRVGEEGREVMRRSGGSASKDKPGRSRRSGGPALSRGAS